jgi:hypothetical protein
MLYRPLNGWQLYTDEGIKREIQQLLRESRKQIGKPKKQPSQGDHPQVP